MTFESEALIEGHTLVFGSKEFDQVPLIVFAGVKQDIDSGKGFIESGFQADDATDGRSPVVDKKAKPSDVLSQDTIPNHYID